VEKRAFALIKASSVVIGVPDDATRLSARNQLKGTASCAKRGAVNAEVGVQLEGGSVVVSIITNGSLALALSKGVAVVAIIEASSIIVGTFDE